MSDEEERQELVEPAPAAADANGQPEAGEEQQVDHLRPEQPSGISWNDRVLVLGYTGSGKSALLDHLFSCFRVQRLLLDTKGHEFAVDGVEPVQDVEAIDWRQPLIHYVDRTGSVEEYEELFAACFARRRLLVRVDELADVCEYQPNRAPRSFRQYVAKGRAHGLGLLAASQRPYLIPTGARTEAQHVFLFGPRLDPEDHRTMAEVVGMDKAELGRKLDELPPFGFYWWNRRTRELRPCPPLPEHLRARAIVKRRTIA